MRFVSRYPSIVYVVQPSQHQFSPLGSRMPNTPSVKATFTNHVFDSVFAAKANHWSPEIREAVETHLKSHGDMAGGGLYVEGSEPDSVILTAAQEQRGLSCVATLTAPDGSTMMCGKRPVIRDDMCAEHVALFLPVTDPEPDESFRCDDCGKGFATAMALQIHTTKMHPAEEEVSVS